MAALFTAMPVNSSNLLHPSVFARTVATLALAVAVTGLPVLAHLAGQPVGIATCIVLGLIAANFAAPSLPPLLIFAYLFQNLFVALVSPDLAELAEFNAIRAYNFVLTGTAWAVIVTHYWTRRRWVDRRLQAAMNAAFWALGFIAIYFVVGAVTNP